MVEPHELPDEQHKPELQFKLRGVAPEHSALQVSLALVAENDGVSRCVGSAFAVAPGLAITASHVIDDIVNYQERCDGYRRADSKFSLTAFSPIDQKVVWYVDETYKSVISDIAFLRFHRPHWWGDGPGQVKPPFARLNLNPPAVGDHVRIFGFPNSELVAGVLNVFPTQCECRVQKVDVRTEQPAWNNPLAHIELEGEIEHGMSGGPCFDRDWNVIGVNSSGWSGVPSSVKVALLWPAMNVEIDLFKTGPFPAIDLFKNGDTAALGYRRVYVTAKREARFAHVDPESLAPSGYLGMTESLPGVIDFSVLGAQEALAELRATLARAQSGSEPLNSNRIIRLARNYFWELEAAVKLAILLATRQLNLSIAEPPTWEQAIKAWRTQTTNGDILDEIAMLDFDWNSVDLFELRAYAELGRSGVLAIQCLVGVDTSNPGPILAASLEPPCRKGGAQLFLPDGLDRFMDAGRLFVQRLLRLSSLPK